MAQKSSRGSGKTVNYFGINKDGYLYRRTDKDNPDKITIKLDDGRVFYHELFTATEMGYITQFGLREIKFKNGSGKKVLRIAIESEDLVDVVDLSIKTQAGRLHPRLRVLAQIAPNIDFNAKYSLSPEKRKSDDGYAPKGLFFNDENGGFVRFKHFFGEKGDIPGYEEVISLGETVRDYSKQDNYLNDILTAQIERFNNESKHKFQSGKNRDDWNPSEDSAPPQRMEVNTKVDVPSSPMPSDDDLPF